MQKTYRNLITEVRKLAQERPDFNYMEQRNNFPPVEKGLFQSCSYIGIHPSYPHLGEGCIFGQALARLGVTREELSEREGEPAGVAADRIIGENEDETDAYKGLYMVAYNREAWMATVQSKQDSGLTWSEAIRIADERYVDHLDKLFPLTDPKE